MEIKNSVYQDEVLADREEDQQCGNGLQQPVEHVELHRDQVPLLPPRPRPQADTRVFVVLLLAEPRMMMELVSNKKPRQTRCTFVQWQWLILNRITLKFTNS